MQIVCIVHLFQILFQTFNFVFQWNEIIINISLSTETIREKIKQFDSGTNSSYLIINNSINWTEGSHANWTKAGRLKVSQVKEIDWENDLKMAVSVWYQVHFLCFVCFE